MVYSINNSYFILFIILIGLIGIFNFRYTIYILIWFIFIVLYSAIFFIFQGADFIGLVTVSIYIIAITIIFLYMILLFDRRYASTRQSKLLLKLKLFNKVHFGTQNTLVYKNNIWAYLLILSEKLQDLVTSLIEQISKIDISECITVSSMSIDDFYFKNYSVLFSLFSSFLGRFSPYPKNCAIWNRFIIFNCIWFFFIQGADFIALLVTYIYVPVIATLAFYTVTLIDCDYFYKQSKWRFLTWFKILLILYLFIYLLLPWARVTVTEFLVDSHDYWYQFDLLNIMEVEKIEVIKHVFCRKYGYNWFVKAIGLFLLFLTIASVDIHVLYSNLENKIRERDYKIWVHKQQQQKKKHY